MGVLVEWALAPGGVYRRLLRMGKDTGRQAVGGGGENSTDGGEVFWEAVLEQEQYGAYRWGGTLIPPRVGVAGLRVFKKFASSEQAAVHMQGIWERLGLVGVDGNGVTPSGVQLAAPGNGTRTNTDGQGRARTGKRRVATGVRS